MGATIIWIIIGVLAFLWRRKIVDAVVACIFILMLFFGVAYMSDNFSNLNLRWFFPEFMYFYEDAVDDPVGTAKEVGGKAKDVATDAVDRLDEEVTKAGEKLDSVLEDSGEVQEQESLDETRLKDEQGENTIIWGTEMSQEEPQKQDKSTDNKGKPTFVEFKDIKEVLKGELSWLSDADKDLVKHATPYMTTKIKGEEITIVAGKDRGATGIIIEYIGVD